MAFWLRRIIIAAAFIMCCSCEKHPIGEMPEVQREQADPAKVWSSAGKQEPEKSASSPAPAEHVPDEAR